MARVKQPKNTLRQHHKRTSWTRFHLPLGQDWPTWSTGYSDAHLGPLAGVAGCQKVWLGRKVEDPEKAALIVLWQTGDSLKNFQNSPACGEFLQGLPENNTQGSLLSGTLLQGLSLGDADSPSLSSPPSRFLSFQWISPYRFEEDLQGRVTFTALVVPYTGSSVPESFRSALHNAFGYFVPRGCEDLTRSPLTRMHFWTAWASVDRDLSQLGQQEATAESESGPAVWCEFRRWNGYSGATPEREEASAKSSLARDSWALTVAKVMPPVTAWRQERWDIQLAPCSDATIEEEEREDPEDVEYQRTVDEYFKERFSATVKD